MITLLFLHIWTMLQKLVIVTIQSELILCYYEAENCKNVQAELTDLFTVNFECFLSRLFRYNVGHYLRPIKRISIRTGFVSGVFRTRHDKINYYVGEVFFLVFLGG